MLVIWRVCCPELGLGSILCVQVPERPPRPTEMQGPTWLCVPTGDCHLNKKESLETGVGSGEAEWGLLLCHFVDLHALTDIQTCTTPRHKEPQTYMQIHIHVCSLGQGKTREHKQRCGETHATHRHTCIDGSGHTTGVHTYTHTRIHKPAHRATYPDVSRLTETHAPDT